MAVYAVRRDEADEMQSVFVALAPRHRLDERGFFGKIAVSDALIDARQILIHDAAGAHRDVPDLRVSHLPRRKSDVFPGRLE